MIRRSILAVATLALALPVFAQEPATGTAGEAKAKAKSELESLKQQIAADKRVVVEKNLSLSYGEDKAFWPLYDEYQKELKSINERISKTLKAYAEAYAKGGIPDSTAKSLLADTIAIEEAEVKAKKAIVAKMNKVLSPARVARYIQIENKIRALVKLDLAAEVPLAGYKD